MSDDYHPIEEFGDRIFHQSGVLAYRAFAEKAEILLIRNRKDTRWVIPKGLVEPDMTPWASAAKEAVEEAGVEGVVSDQLLGKYSYDKWGGSCLVEVYPLAVETILEAWEEDFRARQWHSIDAAASMVDERALRDIIADFDPAG